MMPGRSFICVIRVAAALVIILESALSNGALPDCEFLDERRFIIFRAEPEDVEVGCESDGVAVFPCRYEGTSALPQWIINSTVYSSLNSQLPPDHFYSDHMLSVTNIRPIQNYTTYQCQLPVLSSKSQEICTYRSRIGRLITNCNGLDVHYFPHYVKTSERDILKSVVSTVTQVINYESYYTTICSDYYTGRMCAFDTVPSSSCVDGTCNSTVNLLKSSQCANSTDISITVSIADFYGYLPRSKPMKIDAVNNFVEVSFNDVPATAVISFNQPIGVEKFYTVKYGPANPDCEDLPLQMRGRLVNSNQVSIKLNLEDENSSEICFTVIVSSGGKTVSIEGTHLFTSNVASDVIPSLVVIISVTTCIMVVCLSLICLIVMYLLYKRRTMNVKKPSNNGESGHPGSYQKLEEETSFNLREIDLSTTFFQLSTVPEVCTVSEFSSHHDPPFEPLCGHGFYQITHEEVKHVQPHKRLIFMEDADDDETSVFRKKVPKWTAKQSTIQDQSDISGKDVYIQEKSSSRKLLKGSSFLYCARSKEITAYWKKFTVTEECRESEFLKKIISGYQPEWICYGYFEFTKPEYVKPNQRVIVTKKDDKLVTGPGVRHLMNLKLVGDGSTETQPPNLEEHNEWKRVFLQSDGSDRILTEGTEYLFCAPMSRVNAHYSVHEIPEHCDDTVLSFGRKHNPGFKSESGYGYFEFTQPEYLKPHKIVILMDKGGKLFTGAGAKFIYTGLKNDQDEILRKRKISPPSLAGTKWRHIFLQSHSKNRKLCPKTMFLYCEYKTLTPHLN